MVVLDYEASGELFCNLDIYMEQDHTLLGLRKVYFNKPDGAPDNRGYRLPVSWGAVNDPIVFCKRYEPLTSDTLSFAAGTLLDVWENTITASLLRAFVLVNHSDDPLGGQAATAGTVTAGGSFVSGITTGGTGITLAAGDALVCKLQLAISGTNDDLTLTGSSSPYVDVIFLGEGTLS